MRKLIGGGLALGAVLLAAGCGTGGIVKGGDAARGKTLFSQQCASCHVLADAGATGKVGPNLDDAFAEVRAQGFKQSTIQAVVADQIRFSIPPMPPGLVKGDDEAAVAAYVAAVAGKPAAGGTTTATAPEPATTTETTPAATTTAPATTETVAAGGGSVAEGKSVFASAGCGACHTLKDAGATGNVGPNLDESKPDAALVARRVEDGGGAMPPFKGQLGEAEIAAVAAYVAAVAGK